MPKKRSAMQLAQDNLNRVVKAVKGEQVLGCVKFRVNRYRFTVRDGLIRRHYANGRYGGETCYGLSMPGWEVVPPPERLATAVLALRNDPGLFEFWKKHPGRFRI